MKRRSFLAAGVAAVLSSGWSAYGQVAPAWTADQDRADMMRQLGITALIRGPSADVTAPVHANYDEALANPFPTLPDLLRTQRGERVTTAAQWRERRAELAKILEREVYGRVPATAPTISWTEEVRDRQRVGFTPVLARRVVGRASDPAVAGINIEIKMTVITPANATGPVPLLIMFGRDEFPAPSQPDRAGFERINKALQVDARRARSQPRRRVRRSSRV